MSAQGVDSLSFAGVIKPLSKQFHLYAVDCYGHGGSLHDPAQYNVRDIGSAVSRLIADVIGRKIWLLGHSSGGLIAAYIAAETDWCERLFLEDPPFFSSQGERRKQTFHYIDLSTVCHNYLAQSEQATARWRALTADTGSIRTSRKSLCGASCPNRRLMPKERKNSRTG